MFSLQSQDFALVLLVTLKCIFLFVFFIIVMRFKETSLTHSSAIIYILLQRINKRQFSFPQRFLLTSLLSPLRAAVRPVGCISLDYLDYSAGGVAAAVGSVSLFRESKKPVSCCCQPPSHWETHSFSVNSATNVKKARKKKNRVPGARLRENWFQSEEIFMTAIRHMETNCSRLVFSVSQVRGHHYPAGVQPINIQEKKKNKVYKDDM